MSKEQIYRQPEQANLTYIKSMSDGDLQFEKQLIDIISHELEEEVKIYLENIESKQYKLGAANVHKLKHKIGILGLEQAYQLAIDYEMELLEGKLTLRSEFDNVLSQMSQFLDQI